MSDPIIVGSSRPTEVRLSADGSRLFAADTDGFVRVYDTTTGALLSSWDIGDDLGGMDISPDGTFLIVIERQAITTGDQWSAVTPATVYKVDTVSGARTAYTFQATGYDRTFFDAAILSDGTVLLSQIFAGSGSVTLKVLDPATGVFTAGESIRQSAVLTRSPSGDKVLVDGQNLDFLYMYQTGAGIVATKAAGDAGIQAFNGTLAAIPGGALTITDSSLHVLRTFSQDYGPIADLAFSPDNKWLYLLIGYNSSTNEDPHVLKIDVEDGSIEDSFAVGSALSPLSGVVGMSTGSRLIVDPFERFFSVTANSSLVLVDNPSAITGTPDADTLDGTANADAIYAIGGDDIVNAGGDNDTVHGGDGADVLHGNDGNDSIWTGRGPGETGFVELADNGTEHDQAFGDAGDDTISIGYGDDADGGDGTDTLLLSLAGYGNPIVFDTAGLVSGQPYSLGGGTIQNIEILAYLRGTEFDDTITAATQASPLTVDGGAGNDSITAGSNAVVAIGGAGDDVFFSGSAADSFDGGSGFDTIDYANSTAGVTLTVGGSGTWTGAGGDQLTSVEQVIGSEFADTLTSGGGTVRVFGGGGNDTMFDGAGSDTLAGLDGDDTLIISHTPVPGEIFEGDDGFDTIELRPNVNAPPGGNSVYTLGNLTIFQAERLLFSSSPNTLMVAALQYRQVAQQPDGFNHLALTDVTGGAGSDLLSISTFGALGTTVEMPQLTFTSWNSPSTPDVAGDVVFLVALGSSAWTLIARNDFGSTQYLIGAGGNDTLTGSNGVDWLDASGGVNTLQGNGGDDTLFASDVGTVSTPYTAAGSAFDGGDGHDVLRFNTSMNFQGSIANVEEIHLSPTAGGTTLSIDSATLAALGSSLTLSGTGTLTVNLAAGGTFDASGYVHAPASAVTLVLLAGSGAASVTGSEGSDGIYFGANLGSSSSADGGEGFDQLAVQGDYSGGVTLGAGSLLHIEMLVLLSGSDSRFGDTAGNLYSYDLKTVDANVRDGQQLAVNFNTLGIGENVTFDGSAETDGSFLTYGGNGNDDITGGQQDDGFFFGYGLWGAGDSVDGQGGGLDQLGLQGDYTAGGSGAIVFGAGQLVNVEMIVCLTGGDARFGAPAGQGYSYDLTTDDGNVAAGATMAISANTLKAAGGTLVTDERLTFDGSAETDGSFLIYGGAGGDAVTGGAGADWIYGEGGGDQLRGGAGGDFFAYIAGSDSTSGAKDQLLDFSTGDLIVLTAIDAIGGGGDDPFSFIGSAAFGHSAGQLRAFEQTPGQWQVEGDLDGNGVADLVIAVTTDHALTGADFIL